MKNYIIFIFCCISFTICAQQKYQSLLWKISGNDLKQDSYLYGTMHVSGKVAYRLDDVFYRALLKAETIALESDPGTWLERSYKDMKAADQYLYYKDGFYPELFKLELPKDITVRSAIRMDNTIINAFLYRKNLSSDNFEEETYLDMFIYQAARKNKKAVVALEDLDESRYLVSKAFHNPVKKNPDPWIQKLMEKENPLLIQENAYRNRNLDLLDSIGSAVNTEVFRENMLYIRNENMVKKLDSLLQKTTVFAGVGAAHLPGDKGMIALLRKKGYTVTALGSRQTNYAKTKKEELEETFVQTTLKTESTPDGFLSLKSFDKLRELADLKQKFYLAMDITNGAYLAITRINTYDYLPGAEKISIDKIDNLLYEDIPGTIVKKERITSPFPGISILNKTKKGDHQQYHIYRTPLEVIIIKFAGKQDYVINNADEIFSSVKFRTTNSRWKSLSAASGKYQLLIPENYIIGNYESEGKKIIQSHTNGTYFFLQEAPVYDVNYIEEDRFEAKYLHETFYKNYDLEQSEGRFADTGYSSYESSAKTNNTSKARKIHLKTIVKDNSYYMLGYEGDNPDNAAKFFNSFRFNSIKEEKFETVTDTALHFSVVSNTKPAYNAITGAMSYGKKPKPYEEKLKQITYATPYNEKISVTRVKFHDLQMYETVDSLWAEIDRDHGKDFVISKRRKNASDNIYTYSFILKDTGSIKQIRIKNILKKGVLFELRTLQDSLSEPSEFVSRFYDTFTPADTLLGKDVFTDKTQTFFDTLKKNDSIVLESYNLIKFREKNTDQIIDALTNYSFPDDRKFIKSYLIRALSKLKNDKIPPYLTRLYLGSYADPKTQTAILSALLSKNNAAAYKQLLELLENDFPLDASGVKNLFRKQNKSLKLKKSLFPELLNYVSIEEYKQPVYELLATLKDSNHIRTKDYKKYKNQILNDAKVEIKRNIGKIKNSFYKKSDPLLGYYVKLLFPFRKDKKIALFFNNLLDSDDKEALSSYYVLLKKEGEFIPEKLVSKTLKDHKNRYLLAQKLYENKLLSRVQGITQESFARSKVFEKARYDAAKDSIVFIRERELILDKFAAPVTVYFYMLKQSDEYSSNSLLYYIAFENKNRVNTKPYFKCSSSGVYVKPSKTTEEYITEALNAIKHKTRKRINLTDNQFEYSDID